MGTKKAIDEISNLLCVQPMRINSNMFSAQNRVRLYWTNIPIGLISEKCIYLRDILEPGVPDQSILTPGRLRWLTSENGQATINKKFANIDPEKAQCLTVREEAGTPIMLQGKDS